MERKAIFIIFFFALIMVSLGLVLVGFFLTPPKENGTPLPPQKSPKQTPEQTPEITPSKTPTPPKPSGVPKKWNEFNEKVNQIKKKANQLIIECKPQAFCETKKNACTKEFGSLKVKINSLLDFDESELDVWERQKVERINKDINDFQELFSLWLKEVEEYCKQPSGKDLSKLENELKKMPEFLTIEQDLSELIEYVSHKKATGLKPGLDETVFLEDFNINATLKIEKNSRIRIGSSSNLGENFTAAEKKEIKNKMYRNMDYLYGRCEEEDLTAKELLKCKEAEKNHEEIVQKYGERLPKSFAITCEFRYLGPHEEYGTQERAHINADITIYDEKGNKFYHGFYGIRGCLGYLDEEKPHEVCREFFDYNIGKINHPVYVLCIPEHHTHRTINVESYNARILKYLHTGKTNKYYLTSLPEDAAVFSITPTELK